jgi:hypothetical protein
MGARSEDEVCRALAPLQREGWRRRHSLSWRGRGDIDSLAIAPTGIGFAIETKTRAYDDRHLARVCDQAAWLSRRRRRWCRRGAVPVLCLVSARADQRLERNVLVVSIDLLIPVLRSAAAGSARLPTSSARADTSASASVSNERLDRQASPTTPGPRHMPPDPDAHWPPTASAGV